MSIQDGTIGNRKNAQLHTLVSGHIEARVRDMASKYGITKSDFVRLGIYKMLYSGLDTVDYARSEINNAVAKVKNGYQRTSQRVKDYFTEPGDAYLPAYAPAMYGTNTSYR